MDGTHKSRNMARPKMTVYIPDHNIRHLESTSLSCVLTMHHSFAEECDKVRLGHLGVVGHNGPSNWDHRDRRTNEPEDFLLYIAQEGFMKGSGGLRPVENAEDV